MADEIEQEGHEAEERSEVNEPVEATEPVEVTDETRSPSSLEIRAAREEMRGVRETRVSARSEFELREVPNGTGGTNLRFTGFAAVTGAEYEMEDWIGPWIESVTVGAFRKTLSDGADVAFLLNHEGMTLARTKPGTLKLSEQTDPNASPIEGITGLHSEALLDPQNMYVQAMRSAVERGDLDEMSMAFRVMRQRWSYQEENGDIDRRWLQEVNLDKGDTSLVNYAASPATGGTVALRQRLLGRGDNMERERLFARLGMSYQGLAAALKEIRAGQTISQATRDVLQPILDHLASIDDMVDTDQAGLAELLGVANPDDDDEAGEETEQKSAVVLPFLIPDHTIAARAALAAVRR